ncbi:head-tail connector protein [Limosilactobacillus caviae]|uniref:head-tail connector protein n=1 Tax=Limosilactobacillus caviae TaxID=1769424 RepID=UPI003513FC12
MVSVAQIKQALYLDGDEDDSLIKNYITVAEQFVKNAVGGSDKFFEDKTVQPLYDMAVQSLAATYYQYRLALTDTQLFTNNATVNSIIGQLRGVYETYEEDGTDENVNTSIKPSD